ncbi:MAG: HD domain-containing protein, partial [bacterium]
MKDTNLTPQYASNIIETLTDFQLGAEKVYRFIGNPYVDGDNIAEHTARIVRLAIYTMPFLVEEFKNHPDISHLAEDIYVTVLTHDDEEIAQGFDMVTFLKNHDSRNQEEIDSVKNKMSKMPAVSQDYVMKQFISFREQDTLVSQIAKILDHVAGNQTKMEQKLGIVNPDGAKFTIEYVEKYKGVSKT